MQHYIFSRLYFHCILLDVFRKDFFGDTFKDFLKLVSIKLLGKWDVYVKTNIVCTMFVYMISGF